MQEQSVVQLIISVMPNGSVNVTGPIQDKLRCYGMLECARDAIQAFKAQSGHTLVRAQQLPNNGQT